MANKQNLFLLQRGKYGLGGGYDVGDDDGIEGGKNFDQENGELLTSQNLKSLMNYFCSI